MTLAQLQTDASGNWHVDYSFRNYAALNGINDTERVGKHLQAWQEWIRLSSNAVLKELYAKKDKEPDPVWFWETDKP